MISEESFEGWAVIELMGHRKLGGYVKTTQIMGSAMLRIEVPPGRGQVNPTTQFYAPAALYCMTPTTEEIARGVAQSHQPEPVSVWELPRPSGRHEPKALVSASEPDEDDNDDDEEYEYDDGGP